MRRALLALAVLAAAVPVAGCNTDQPATNSKRTAAVGFTARANSFLEDCYDRWIDNDGDGNPDVFDKIVCDKVLGVPPDGDPVENRVCPWRYSVRFIILRAGQTFPEVIAGSVNNGGTFPVFGSQTQYDLLTQAAPIRVNEPPFVFLNPRRVAQGHPDYMSTLVPPIVIDLPNVLGIEGATFADSPRFDVAINSGDTLIVEARKQKVSDGAPILPFGVDSNLQLTGQLYINGVLTTASRGSQASLADDGSGFSFSFTAP